MQMIMFVLDNPDQLDAILDTWHAVGISGVTIVESTGLHRRRAQLLGSRYLLPLSLLVERVEQGHYTLFAAVPDAGTVEKCLEATEQVVGDLAEPNTGIFVAWELALTKGISDQNLEAGT